MNRREFLLAVAALPFLAPTLRVAVADSVAGAPVALVTADTEAHVVAVSLTTGKVRRRLPTLAGPRSIESVEGRAAVVAHTTEGAVSIVDLRPLVVRGVVHGFSEPRYTAVRPGGRLVYVTDSDRGEVVVLDVDRGRVLHRTEVGGHARHVSLDRSGRWLWTALGSKAQEVAILDVANAERPKLVRRLRPGFLAHDVCFTPDGHRVWVTSGDRGAIEIYDSRTRRVVRSLPGGAPPQHVAFGNGMAFVTSGDDGTLHAHAINTGRLLHETAIPVGSYNVATGWGRVMTPSLERGTLVVCDGRGHRIGRVQVAAAAHDACFVTGV